MTVTKGKERRKMKTNMKENEEKMEKKTMTFC
jgi:hypothetical protein